MKSKFTKAKDISLETKKEVLKRQNNKSIFGTYLTLESANFHHFVERSSSGVGYQWNIVALSFEEHRSIHDHQPIKVNGVERYTYDEAITLMRNHLIINYVGWSEKKCKYKKGYDEEDYEIVRRGKL